ncbi:ATPase, T2SS/T4P/T4SS family [Asanoa sp. NPDC050611]|uniref:CpaF family protein n=1 Tax=Asanoa sp. NPDC050611 TaxID=3157098 RepID=UPI0033CA16A3
MRFEPVAQDPRAATSTVPPLLPNGRHHQPEPTASPQPPTPQHQTQQLPTQQQTQQHHRRRIDFALIRELRRELSERLTHWQRGRDYTPGEEDLERTRLAAEVVAAYADAVRRAGTPLHAADERALLDQVTAELVGLGRLQSLLIDESIEEVHILGCDQVRITRHGGGVDWGDPIADSDEEMVEILQAAARRAGATERSLSTSKPTLDLQLPDGSRLAAVFLVSHRPYAVIRRHNTLDVTLDELAGARADLDEMIDPLVRDFLRAAMRAGLNIMVAGLAGAGKTTVIRALMNEIPADEPYVLLEESRELLPARRLLKHRAVMSFEAREGHGERGFDGRPAGEVTIADLIPVSLRMGVLRIIVGEVRSREIVPMLQAMTTSRGSMCTIHARTPGGVSERIIELALSHGREMTVDQARRMAGNALDLIVYVTVEDETAIGGRKHRFISHIEEVIGVSEHNRIATTTVFGPGADGRAIPRHLPERVRDQLFRIGYDARMLTRYIEAGVGAWRRPRHTQLQQRGAL